MNAAVVGASVLVALVAWVALFRGDRDDIWPRTWVIALALIAWSLGALALAGDLDDVVGPVDPVAVGAGLGVGLAWLVATHVGHALLCRLFPSFIEQVQDLYRLGVDDPPRRVLAPIVAMAAAEELLFRGVVAGLGGFALGVLVYTAVQFVEGKWALTLAAFLGGLVWGGLQLATGGIIAPIIAHALWTGSLTVVWPLRGCGPRRILTPADDVAVSS